MTLQVIRKKMTCNIIRFWLLAIYCPLVSLSSLISETEIYGFNGENLKLNLNDGNNGSKNDIFKMLSGFSYHKGEEITQLNGALQSFMPILPKYSVEVPQEDITENDIDKEIGYESLLRYSSLFKKYIQLANQLSYSGSAASDMIEDVVSTVKKVTTIYSDVLMKRVNESDSMFLEDENHGQYGITALASKVISTLLLPNNLEENYENRTVVSSEDEILEHLASLIVGSEDRGGGGYGGHGGDHYGLTKDPITIIALLALAAYLIRAIIEFLRATSGKRSVQLFDYPGLGHFMPDFFSSIPELIDGAQLKYERIVRS